MTSSVAIVLCLFLFQIGAGSKTSYVNVNDQRFLNRTLYRPHLEKILCSVFLARSDTNRTAFTAVKEFL